MGSIYKQLSMGRKKGELGHLWLAAHFPNRIRKQLVEQTNITSSVDKIMVDQLPVVTYRILGFLLLGVARIYSKKVEYLLIDCNKSLNEMKFHGGKSLCSPPPESSTRKSKANANEADIPVAESSSGLKRKSFIEAMRSEFPSISLPENFELNAFDIQVVDDETNEEHVKSHLEITLPDAWENDRSGQHTFSMDRWGASTSFADHVSDYAPITSISPSNAETSAENLRNRFSLEEGKDFTLIPSIAIETGLQSTHSIEDREDENDNSLDECTIVSEMTLSTIVDNILLKSTPKSRQLSVSITETPQSKVTVVKGERKSEFMAVRTPASKEPRRSLKKRKSVYDDILVVSNSEYKDWIEDASDLVCKRRKAPTDLLALKKHPSFDYFSHPIIPIKADVGSVICTNEIVLTEEVAREPDFPKVEELATIRSFEETEGEAIAPSTPVSQLTSFRFNEAPKVGPASSFESAETQRFPIKDIGDLDEIQMEEGPSSLVQDNYENVHVAEKWSAITKNVGSYLHSNLINKKSKGEEEVVKLSHLLKDKTRKESARFFTQILVLKTGGFINVKQEKAYDDICVMETSKLKKVFEP